MKSYTVHQADQMAQFIRAVFEYADHDDKMFRDDDILNVGVDSELFSYDMDEDKYYLEDWV